MLKKSAGGLKNYYVYRSSAEIKRRNKYGFKKYKQLLMSVHIKPKDLIHNLEDFQIIKLYCTTYTENL